MNADLWGLVLGFALRLDLLDRACLADVRNFARVCKALSLAAWRLDKTALRLRVRVHRVFDFRDPLKSRVRELFPNFLGDNFYASAPNRKNLCLVELAKHIIKYKDVGRWLASAEARPARLQAAKREREAEAETKLTRRRLLQSELEARGLPMDELSVPFLDFIAGRTKTTSSVVSAMETLKQERWVLAYLEARDKSFQAMTPTPESRVRFLTARAAALGLALDLDVPAVRDFVAHGLKSGPRALARLYIAQAVGGRHTASFENDLEHRTSLRAGELMLKRDVGDDLDGEAALWTEAVKGVVSRFIRRSGRSSSGGRGGPMERASDADGRFIT